MKIHTETVTLPAYWASAIINSDHSGYNESEIHDINNFVENNPHYGLCLSCSDYPELKIFNGLLTDCLEYTFPVNFYRTTENGINYIVYPAQTKLTKFVNYRPSVSGYGKKIPTSKMVLLCGIWRRVYCTVYSNAGSVWINFQGNRVIVESLF